MMCVSTQISAHEILCCGKKKKNLDHISYLTMYKQGHTKIEETFRKLFILKQAYRVPCLV